MTTITRAQRRQLERENAKRPAVLTEVPRTQWPNGVQQPDCVRVWVSRDYLVQEFACVDPLVNARLSIFPVKKRLMVACGTPLRSSSA